jgi:hypothetical protein
MPVGGGGYLRLLPQALVHRCLAADERRARPALVYVHPWELDPDQPTLPLGPLAQWRHRVNLHKTAGKLARLLQAHRFDTARGILDHLRTGRGLPVFRLAH